MSDNLYNGVQSGICVSTGVCEKISESPYVLWWILIKLTTVGYVNGLLTFWPNALMIDITNFELGLPVVFE